MAALLKSFSSRRRDWVVFAMWGLVLMLAAPLSGAIVGSKQQPPQLRDLAVLEDKAGRETIQTISSLDPRRFRLLPAGSLAAGYSRSVHWLRFTLDAPAGEWWLDILPPYLDDLRLYEPDSSRAGAFIERRAGDTLALAAREADYRGFLFKLRHADDAPRTYFLRLSTTSSAVVVPRLWTPDTFYAQTVLEYSFLMVALAVIAVAILFNVNAWIWLRDDLTPWYLAYLVSLEVNFIGIDGFLQQYITPEWPQASYYAVGASTLCAIAFANVFYRMLFMVKREESPLLYRLYQACFWLPLGALASLPLGYYPETVQVILATVPPMNAVGLVLSIRLWRRQSAGAGVMLIANLISIAGIFLHVLNIQGLISSSFILLYSVQFSSIGTVLALQIALGARYRVLRDDRLQAEQAAQRERDARSLKSEFLSMFAHEERNALAVLRMALGMQPMTPDIVASAERAVQSISDVIERLEQSEMLMGDALKIERIPCDIGTLLEAVVADSRDPDRVRVTRRGTPDVATDPRLLRMILASLVDNALKYGRRGAPIDVLIDYTPGKLAISVANEIGSVGKPDPEKVFQRYYRGARAHGYTGSGLGLHIAHALAVLLGGDLQYLAQGETTVFRLHL